ncbi:hypothetical protein DOTSEDRAFT_83018 [Dothistroma septosporum NZE10]|uniref:Uncharacterized protein n=1 Tax=Dothistroma septosporum (strain NZE10 / CBS 128990) TaxID=675120 RepID=M2YJT1_DOTSN|nr:hypothetical protein DOTSEDRAFT_83018 [Dothistroma septosporum NZE10]
MAGAYSSGMVIPLALAAVGYASPVHFQDADVVATPSNATSSAIPGSDDGLNITDGLERRMNQPADDALIHQYEVRGRTLLTDFMLANVDQYARLMTAATGGFDDPHRGGWQRGGTGDTGDYATGAVIAGRLKQAWTVDPVGSHEGALAIVHDALACLDVGDGLNFADKNRRALDLGMFPNGPNFEVLQRQNLQFETFPAVPVLDPATHTLRPRRRLAATAAVYDMVFNVVDGVIVAKASTSPHQAAARAGRQIGNGPRVQTWSDVAWWTWMDLKRVRGRGIQSIVVGSEPRPKNVWQLDNKYPWANENHLSEALRGLLNYIVVEAVEAPDSRRIFERCMVVPRANGDESPTYFIGSWCYYALLAIPEVQDLVQFLAQHKLQATLGHKVLESVRLFPLDASLTLVWAVTDAGKDVTQILSQAESTWLPAQLLNSHLTNIPNMPSRGSGFSEGSSSRRPAGAEYDSQQYGVDPTFQEPLWENLVLPNAPRARHNYH